MSIENSLKKFENSVKGKFGVLYDYSDIINPSGDFKRLEGINVIIFSLRNLLLTPLESYPFNSRYGSLLYKKVWEPLDEDTLEEIEYEVKDRVVEFDPRIEVEKVELSTLSDNKGVSVSVHIKRNNETGIVNIDFSNMPDFGLE